MAESAVTFLLEQLKEEIVWKKDLILGAANEFEQLRDEFDLLKAFPMEKNHYLNYGHRSQLRRLIRKVVYEVDDTMDTCLTMAIEAKVKSRRSAISERFTVAKEVRSIREERVLPLFDQMERIAYGFGAMEDRQPSLLRDTPIRQNKVVGLEDEEEVITGYLMEKTEHLDVMSIMGIPGQGKTTLAWKIYHSNVICYHFPIRIWVYLSQEFNSRDVFLQILKKFTPSQDTSSLSDYELAQTVSECLEKEMFLLVLDDVWSVDAWNQIKDVLPLHNGEGKVLITTREIDVGMRCSVYRKPHELRFLDNDESWRLLQYEVFGNLEDCPEELGHMGNHIAIKCEGVPLAIVVIGCILADQLARFPSSAVSEWVMVSKNVSEVLQSDEGQRLIDVVGLSFHGLPDELKECFIFLGVFPEDYEIPAKMLCMLWISEGFVRPRNGRSLEKSAEKNMNDLMCRNLLKAEKTNHAGKVKTCRVHAMIRAFCISISKDENFCQEIKRSKLGTLEPPVSEIRNSLRLCFSSDLSKFLSENPYGPGLRSFLCFDKQPVELEPHYISVIPDNFPKLRILESKCIKFHQFPAKIVKLLHLRYLTLNIETLNILPESITQLWNLQSLVVETKSHSITMKANMWTMFSLRYLKTRAAIVLDNKLEGEAGQDLHTLNRLSPESCTETVSRRAKNLKTLGISGKLACIFETDFLEKLHQLEKLKLENSLTSGLPQRICNFPPNLKRLTLTNTYLRWKHMSTLSMIKSLEALKLKDNAFVGASWKVYDYNFPSLQFLLMVDTDLIQWEASTDAFPRLRFLVVKNCEYLREIPECVGRHLEKLEVYRVDLSVIESAKKIAETKKGKPKGKFGVQFSLRHSIIELESNV